MRYLKVPNPFSQGSVTKCFPVLRQSEYGTMHMKIRLRDSLNGVVPGEPHSESFFMFCIAFTEISFQRSTLFRMTTYVVNFQERNTMFVSKSR